MSSTTEAPLIPDLEAPPVYTPSTEAVAMSDDKKTLHAQNGPSVTLVVEAGTSKNSVTRAIDVRVINKEKLRKKRQILLKGIGFHMALGLFEVCSTRPFYPEIDYTYCQWADCRSRYLVKSRMDQAEPH